MSQVLRPGRPLDACPVQGRPARLSRWSGMMLENFLAKQTIGLQSVRPLQWLYIVCCGSVPVTPSGHPAPRMDSRGCLQPVFSFSTGSTLYDRRAAGAVQQRPPCNDSSLVCSFYRWLWAYPQLVIVSSNHRADPWHPLLVIHIMSVGVACCPPYLDPAWLPGCL